MTNRALNGNGVNSRTLHEDFEHVHINGNGANGNGNISSSEGSTNGTETKIPQRRRMDRKKSSPMAPTFMVSAPGKVIVFGEHAVVHGKVSLFPLAGDALF